MFTQLGRAFPISLSYVGFVKIPKFSVFCKIIKIRKDLWDRLHMWDVGKRKKLLPRESIIITSATVPWCRLSSWDPHAGLPRSLGDLPSMSHPLLHTLASSTGFQPWYPFNCLQAEVRWTRCCISASAAVTGSRFGSKWSGLSSASAVQASRSVISLAT